MNEQKTLPPTAISALVTGILSVALSSLVIVGIILGCVSLSKVRTGFQDLKEHPDLYGNTAMLKAGRITSIIGIISSILWIAFWILYFYFIIEMVSHPTYHHYPSYYY